MQISILALIGIAVAAMFFGYGFGLFEGRGQGYKKGKQEAAQDKSLAQPIPPPSPPVPAPSKPAVPPETVLLKLSLDEHEQPRLLLDGQPVDTAGLQPHQRKRLIDLMVVMRPWVEAAPVQKQAVPPSPPAPTPAPQEAFRTAPTIPPAARSTPQPSEPVSAPSPANAPADAASAPTTMVGQIDAILQTQLLGTPLAGKGIRLVESAQGGAMVIVGTNRYAGVGEVPDPEIQAVLRAAIAEWEKRYTPG